MKKSDNRMKIWLIVVLVSMIFLIFLSIVSNAIEIGEKLSKIHVSVEIAFYVLIVLVVGVGIVYPMVSVFFSPIFSLERLHNTEGKAKKKWCKKLVDNLLKNADLTDEEKNEVKELLKNDDDADDRIIEFFDRKIRPQLNQEIFSTAKKVFLATALSPNATTDMIAMMVYNFNLIKNITQICGFRPSNVQILRLYIRVYSITFIAGSLEEMNMEEPISNILEGIPGMASGVGKAVGFVAAPLIQGATNAFTTLRIGTITKNYLLNADVSKTRKELKKESYTEALGMLRDIVKQGAEEKIFQPLKRFFSKKKEPAKETTEENNPQQTLWWKF